MQEVRLEFGLEEIESTASRFLALTKGSLHFAFYGDMGIGKTTFITALCKQLGTDDLVSSPTFAIVNEYACRQDIPIFHFDFYRIKAATELLDIGFYDYCREEAWCFIEWPDKAEEIIPDDFIAVNLSLLDRGKRQLRMTI